MKKGLMERQTSWLFACLHRNRGSRYGKRYQFEDIYSVSDYQEQVPLITYEDIASEIERIAHGEENVLFEGAPIAFEETGGSSKGGKLIPYTKESFEDFQRAILPWFEHTMQHYSISGRASYWSISPALRTERRTPSGMVIGVEDVVYLGEEKGIALAEGIVVPMWVGSLKRLSDWQLATLYWLICAKELELISIWSPTFLLVLLQVLEEKQEALRTLLGKGGVIDGHSLLANVEALERFETYLQTKETIRLWPKLKLISCWEDAMSKPYAVHLKSHFSGVAFQPKGLISTESVVTIPDSEGMPLLCCESAFYEFIDEQGTVLLADALSLDAVYEVVVTTNGGLYRYCSGDMVRYAGMKAGIPILYFMGRKGAVSDMTGEKLSEAFVQQALEEVKGFSMLVAHATQRPHYLLLGESEEIEGYMEKVESRLLENPQYAYARKVGQLGALQSMKVENVMESYIEYKTMQGSRIGDIKVPLLVADEKWLAYLRKEAV